MFVNRKKSFNKIKILKIFTIFYTHAKIILVWNAAYNSEFIELQSFFDNYSEIHRIIPGGSMGKMISKGQRYGKYFAIYFTSRRLVITEAAEV